MLHGPKAVPVIISYTEQSVAARLTKVFNFFSSRPPACSVAGLIGDDQFREGLVSGFLLIFFSEIGDKTFFIALLLALRQDRTAVFTGTFSALAGMTVISVALGQVRIWVLCRVCCAGLVLQGGIRHVCSLAIDWAWQQEGELQRQQDIRMGSLDWRVCYVFVA